MKTFAELGLSEPILRALSTEGFSVATPIQEQSIPVLMAGKDLLGIAQTGTGKTAAFALPLLEGLKKGRKPLPKAPSHLILAPTRELAAQIAQTLERLGRPLQVRVGLVVGGAKPGPQIRALGLGLDILVATPGRLMDHMQAGHVRLDHTRSVVLDEADQMMDLGFLPAIQQILSKLPRPRQTALFSATMPPEIRRLGQEFLTNPVEVSVAPAAQPIAKIQQTLLLANQGDKAQTLVGLLETEPVNQAIVFTRTKHGADRLEKTLRAKGVNAQAIHGDKNQGQRDRALAAFRSGRVHVLVATDVAARGIDVEAVTHVFNYDLPNVPEAYVHRIGRTGRNGREGHAISLCDPSEYGLVLQIERLTQVRLLPDGVRRPSPVRGFKTGSGRPNSSGQKQHQRRANAPKPHAVSSSSPSSPHAGPRSASGTGAGAGRGAFRPGARTGADSGAGRPGRKAA